MKRRTHKPSRRRAQAGFLMLEVLAALGLFAIVATGTGVMAMQSMRHLVANRHASHAATLAQEELEYQRGLDYGDIITRNQTRTMAEQSYNVATVVTADSPAGGMKSLTVTVSWTGPEGSKSYAVRTIYTTVNS